ncbi:MAG TPA: hypothetical protein VJ914_07025 [Pseudonocardiaceae bacterium]|nr:hypothetical protein [Pseudonocardiaceae bacterium]
MDFSLHERRRLAQIEQELSGDRRLVAMLGILGTKSRKPVLLLRYVSVRLRRPGGRRSRPATLRYRFAVTLLLISAVLLLAAPAGVAVAIVLNIPLLIALSIAILPLPPLAFLLSRRWVRGLRSRQP